jgi:hypothetical protein
MIAHGSNFLLAVLNLPVNKKFQKTRVQPRSVCVLQKGSPHERYANPYTKKCVNATSSETPQAGQNGDRATGATHCCGHPNEDASRTGK